MGFRQTAFAVVAILIAGCSEERADAYGNFEADPVAVSAEIGGKLLRFDVREGLRIETGRAVAQVDSLQLVLQRRELEARRDAVAARADEASARVAVLREQIRTARDDRARIRRLHESGAATAAERNRAEGEVRVLERRTDAARAGVRLARRETDAAAAGLRRVEDRIERTTVRNPVRGTVLADFAEPGEVVQPGRVLYTIASLDTLTLRAYASGGQLARLMLGAEVRVLTDAGPDSLAAHTGRISWIASETEFTPTPIQTRKKRVGQVYAFEVRVPNPDGTLKIGMPGEVLLSTSSPRDTEG